MNLKEKVESFLLMLDYSYGYKTKDERNKMGDNIKNIAESYAKEKAWSVWEIFSIPIQGTRHYNEEETKQAFNQWWEENK